MEISKTEDTILLIDTSRSMVKKYPKPIRISRLAVALQASKNFIQTKFAIDPKDNISLISFGSNPKRLCPYTYDKNVLFNSLKKIQITGKGDLHQAIAFALQIIIQEMRKISGKIHRIFIISDNKLNYQKKIEKIVNLAKGLGVYIDVCQIGKPQDYKTSSLKRIADFTNGDYGYFNNPKAIINSGKEYASKKLVRSQPSYYSNKIEKVAPLMSEIALPLRRPTLMEIRSLMRESGIGEKKCGICHSIKAPLTNADFYAEGRYCPNCDRPVHLSCAAMWAKKSEDKKNVFRCPFCFFLITISRSAMKMFENLDKAPEEPEIIEESNIKEVNMIEIKNIDQINASCSYCYNIFLGDFKVFKCENCGSFYHEPCLQKMYTEWKACRFCGAKIINM